GTGGTLTGAGRRLKDHNPEVKVIAAEPELGELVYGLRSLDEGFVPPILDESVLDGKFLVRSSDALRATRELTEKEGIFAGISSGAVLHVAMRLAARIDQGDVVCLLADGGWKYLSTKAWAPDVAVAEQEDVDAAVPMPGVGVIEPGVRAARRATRNGRIGLIGTVATVSSGAYQRALARLDPSGSVTMVVQACPLFVEFVERGDTTSPSLM